MPRRAPSRWKRTQQRKADPAPNVFDPAALAKWRAREVLALISLLLGKLPPRNAWKVLAQAVQSQKIVRRATLPSEK